MKEAGVGGVGGLGLGGFFVGGTDRKQQLAIGTDHSSLCENKNENEGGRGGSGGLTNGPEAIISDQNIL